MARPCLTCSSPNRDAIEADLWSEKPVVEIADATGIYVRSLRRHRQNHMGSKTRPVPEKLERPQVPVVTEENIASVVDLQKKGLTQREIAKALGVSTYPVHVMVQVAAQRWARSVTLDPETDRALRLYAAMDPEDRAAWKPMLADRVLEAALAYVKESE